MLHDWRTAIGTGALNMVKNYFLNPANGFDEEGIKQFVSWALHPQEFNFIYRDPDAEQVRKCLIKLQVIYSITGEASNLILLLTCLRSTLGPIQQQFLS
jgi:hypothetical protein